MSVNHPTAALFPCPVCHRDGATADDGHAICRDCERGTNYVASAGPLEFVNVDAHHQDAQLGACIRRLHARGAKLVHLLPASKGCARCGAAIMPSAVYCARCEKESYDHPWRKGWRMGGT